MRIRTPRADEVAPTAHPDGALEPTPTAPRPAPPQPAPDGQTPRRRRAWIVGATVALVVVAVALLVWWLNPTLQPPGSLEVDTTGATSVGLRWDPPDGRATPDSYVVLRGDREVGSVDAPDTSFEVTGLTPNTTYDFAVVSVAGGRRSEPSTTTTATTDPGAPVSLRAEDVTATSAVLRWDAPAGPRVDSYAVVNEGDTLGVVPHPETAIEITDLIPGGTYEFDVVARDGARRSSAASLVVTAVAPSPVGLVADADSTTTDTVVVRWSPPPDAPAPSAYVVRRDGATVTSLPGDTTSFTDTGLAPATAYEYEVVADWGHEPSAPTDVLVVTTAEPPIGDARLAGRWPVEITVVDAPGNLEEGTSWTSTWDLTPACGAGPCDVSLAGAFSAPGFTYRSFEVDLTRDGASYTGSATAQITHCDTVPVDNTVTVRLDVEEAGTVDGEWVARAWTGTIEIASPYVDVGQRYCPAQAITADLASAPTTAA